MSILFSKKVLDQESCYNEQSLLSLWQCPESMIPQVSEPHPEEWSLLPHQRCLGTCCPKMSRNNLKLEIASPMVTLAK